MADYAWLLGSAILVFLMQAGFLCLETGKSRSKNSINVAAKNLSDFILASIVFWLFGFGLMFGDSMWGIFGRTEFFFGADNSAWQISFFLFQLMFCGTAATLLSGAVAERMSYYGYLLVTLVLCSFIYPVVGHWVWASAFASENIGWLQTLGFVDFAGSTVVHSVGGWVALAAIIIIGPRLGRFDQGRELPVGSNLPMSGLGTLLIWLGWFGFNGGSTLIFNGEVPSILLNTCLAAVWGGLASALIYLIRHKYVDVTYILNGIISGLVSITAAAHAVSSAQASLIGIIAGTVFYGGSWLLEKYKLDDALGVVPAHLFAGIWGTLAVAIFGNLESLATSLTRMEQLYVQILGILCIGLFSFVTSYLLLRLINYVIPLRVSARQEVLGMNITEHNATTELIELLSSMREQEVLGQFNQQVPEEPFTEVGQIAKQYNRVINRVKDEMSKRDRAIDNFKTSEKRKSAILDASMDSIITIGLQGEIIEFNPAAERTFGQRKRQVLKNGFIDLFVQPEDKDEVNRSLKHKFSVSDGLLLNRRNRITLTRISGDTFPAEITVTGTAFGAPSESEFTLHIRDVTRQQKLQNRLKQLAYNDPLTGLYNRTYLLNALNQTLESCQNNSSGVAVFFLDLDRFKTINDTLGHKAGDELLIEVAARLVKVTRQSDTIARWGGDEFVIMMSGNFDETVVNNIAELTLSTMREPLDLSGRQIKVLTSIGVAIKADEFISAESLIQQADIAMYYAKEAGRDNHQIFRLEMANKASRQFHHEQALRHAVNAAEQFLILYQPKVDGEGAIIGLEALVRWQQPQGDLINPNDFIPLAEEVGLIVTLEQLIIEKVASQLNQWHKAGIPLVPVAINISGKHLESDTLLPSISRTLDKHDIPGDVIEIEVTESVFVTNIEHTVEVLKGIKKLNIKIAIDDFGTGYSSLSYLKSLPVDVLKIDRSFVDECASSNEDARICATIINLAKSLELTTVAEGVENHKQFEFLRTKGCNTFQGYHFYHPLPPEDIMQLLYTDQALICS